MKETVCPYVTLASLQSPVVPKTFCRGMLSGAWAKGDSFFRKKSVVRGGATNV